jgi:prepilin signal peptidase PulO-like enzyme (type II secretory pathway)
MNEPSRAASNLKKAGMDLWVREALLPDGKNRVFIFVAVVLSMLYTVIALLLPASEKSLHILVILILMVAASFEDIKEKQIPFILIGGIFVINVIRSVFFTGDYVIWVAAAAFSAVMLCVHLIKRDAVGLGDIMLLGLGISSLAIEDILSFLFLSFLFSSIYGIIQIVLKKEQKGSAVPMAPCITLAWIAVTFI